MAKPNFEALIDLIKLANPQTSVPFSVANLEHAAPVVLTEGAKNTSIVVSGKAAVGFGGSVTFTYNRLDLAAQLTQLGVVSPLELQIPNDGAANGQISSAALLPLFNAAAGVELQEEDIVVEQIVLTDSPAEVDYTITIKADSLKWTGSVAVKLVEDAMDIAAELTNHELSGFEYATA